MREVLSKRLPQGVVDTLRNGRVLANRLVAGRMRRVERHSDVSIRRFGSLGSHVFFGYYDLCPMDPKQERLLALRVPLGARAGGRGPAAEIGFFRLAEEETVFTVIGQTRAWCWQQGSRLRWMPGSEEAVFTNSHDGNHHAGLVLEAGSGRQIRAYDHPIYDISPCGHWGLTLNFARLERLRPGYGYNDLPDSSSGQTSPFDDGVFLIDMESGAAKLLLSLEEAANLSPHASMSGAIHYFNHLSWNHDGSRFLVFHIWEKAGERRAIRVIIGDRHGNFQLLTNGTHVSHYWWLDNRRILLYSTPPEMPEGYYLYTVDGKLYDDGSFEHFTGVMPQGDGHPSLAPDGRSLVTDTLPGRTAERGLYLHDMHSKRLHKAAAFYSPLRYSGPERCDLHPRWSPDSRSIIVDSADAGRRQLAVLNVSRLLGQEGL